MVIQYYIGKQIKDKRVINIILIYNSLYYIKLDQTFYQNVDGSYDKTPNVYAPGGKGANQAVAAARAGAKTTIITRIGKDEIGENILENLRFNNDYSNIYINIKYKDKDI